MDDLTLDLTANPAVNPEDRTLKSDYLARVQAQGSTPAGGALMPDNSVPRLQLKPYTPERQQQQRDYVRMVVTISVLVIFAWVILWASIESRSWPNHWNQTKEMLQIVLPAVTGLIGSVTGFYFGAEVRNSNSDNKSVDPVTGK